MSVDFTYDLGGIELHVTAHEKPGGLIMEPPEFDSFEAHYEGYDNKGKKMKQVDVELDSISVDGEDIYDVLAEQALEVWEDEQAELREDMEAERRRYPYRGLMG